MDETLLLILIFLPFILGAGFAVFPKKWTSFLGLAASFAAFLHFLIVIHFSLKLAGNETILVRIRWVDSIGINLTFLADGLALFFSLLVTGMGTLILFYANYFMDAKDRRIRNFYSYMLFFMGSMLGSLLADNLIVFFLFWEITGLMSYFLISYHFEHPPAREAARMAFLITSLAGLCMLVGIIALANSTGTLEISEMVSRGIDWNQGSFFAIMVLLLVGIAAKSAQFPFHFWLPEAMMAPTPVSAYLHSATMVKLGIYFLARIYILFVASPIWLPLVTWAALLTIIIGGLSALFSTSLKRILAYATISQLGFFVCFYGLGDPDGLQYDYVHIFNHALYKASLFMIAGILAHSAHVKEIQQLKGIRKNLPLLSFIFLISIAAMAGVPGTTGFMSKELLLGQITSLLNEGYGKTLIFFSLLAGFLFKVAFSYRLFHYAFITKKGQDMVVDTPPKLPIMIPSLLLSSLALFLGIFPNWMGKVLHDFTIPGLHKQSEATIALWHGFTINLLLSALLFAGGITLFRLIQYREVQLRKFFIYPIAEIWYKVINSLPHAAGNLTRLIHSLKPQVNLMWAFGIFSFFIGSVIVQKHTLIDFSFSFSPLGAAQTMIVAATFLLLAFKHPINKLIMLSLIGFLITYYFTLKNAPDLAITQMVVEVATLFIFVLALYKIDFTIKARFTPMKGFISLATGISAALIPFYNGSMNGKDQLAAFFLKNSLPLAHGTNVVNTILVDFRGLDTLGEISVVSIAALGVFLLCKNKTVQLSKRAPLITTPMLPAIMPTIFVISIIFSIFLLIRGHNYPGGGFSGGVVAAISFILLSMSHQSSKLVIFNQKKGFTLMFFGLLLATCSAAASLFIEGSFMASYFWGPFSTVLVFDTGIYLLVAGALITMIRLMRRNTIQEEIL